MKSPKAKQLPIIAMLLIATSTAFADTTPPLRLAYDRPATTAMHEAIPVGNGRLGAMVFGIPQAERIILNDISLWTGADNPTGDYKTMGSYSKLGELNIALPGHEAATNYNRGLDIGRAVADVTYSVNGVHFKREVFVSHPTDVIVIRLTADKPGQYTGRLTLADGNGATTVATDTDLTATGALSSGMKYETQLHVLNIGGRAAAGGDGIDLVGCDSVTIIIGAGTDYVMDAARRYKGDDPHPRVATAVAIAAKQTFDALLSDHVADFRKLFDRVSLDLGASPEAARKRPSDQRKNKASAGGDPEMEALLFQYGRYLLISSSRPGSLPANLQGMWNDSNKPAWFSDYHTNINIQMNYWPADVTNLGECHLPLFDLVRSQLPDWRKATAETKELNTADGKPTTRGFAVRTSHNITGGMGWRWDKTANAWYALHFWEHYAFSQDKTFLRETAFPVLKEVSEYWLDHLKALPDGRLVVPNAWSPEHGPTEDGVTYAQQIVGELFTDTLAACDALNTDPALRQQISAAKAKLAQPGVGSWGQLMEWMTEKTVNLPSPEKLANLTPAQQRAAKAAAELDTPNDHHRHTSHLFGVYPGTTITPLVTPKLADAARVSLTARGSASDSDVTEWAFAWRASLWARLGDGEAAHDQLLHFLADRNSNPNLFGLHNPKIMQIDGNFGVTAAFAEMLVQSQDGTISLLPALPKAWPTGSVRGLRARGAITVNITWADGQLTSATLRADRNTTATVRFGQTRRTITLPGESDVVVQP